MAHYKGEIFPMKILVTGAAGFIGAAVCQKLAGNGHRVIGIDNLNSYYSTSLKIERLGRLGLDNLNSTCRLKSESGNFEFIRADLCDLSTLIELFSNESLDIVIHLAAQAGVRFSLIKPNEYISSNVQGFLNILECCRLHPVKQLLYASSSSVYGKYHKIPFSVLDNCDHPANLYAATKRANELMAHSYSHLFRIPTTGLRFFTVYGPWGRPDMAPMIFADLILKGEPLTVFNNGNMKRDFTYIDDIVESISRLLLLPPKPSSAWQGELGVSWAPYRLLNIGRGEPVELLEFIRILENELGKKAHIQFADMHDADVESTWADTTTLENLISFRPSVSINEGVQSFAKWYMSWKKND